MLIFSRFCTLIYLSVFSSIW